MFVDVYGVRGKKKTALVEFAEWLGYRLMGDRLAPNVSVTILVSKFEGNEQGYHGFVEYEDCNLRPREFLIHVNKQLNERDMFETLAHEMVHVKQDARQERQERHKNGHRIFWKGEDHTKTPYSKQPWEREAYRLDKKLVREYFGE